MHEFDFINRPKELLTPEVVALLTRLHECRGRQELFIEAEPDVLTALLEVAKIQSTDVPQNPTDPPHPTASRASIPLTSA